MSQRRTQVFSSPPEFIGIEPEADLPEIIGDEWADPEECLNDFCSDDVEVEIELRKHFTCP